MRVGLVAPRFAPFVGGLETYVATAAAGLAEIGADVVVVTQAPKSADLPNWEEQDGYVIERYQLPLGECYDLPSPHAVRAASRAGRFDVLWVHGYHTPLAWLVTEATRQTPIVCTPHYHGVGHTPLRNTLHRFYRPAGRRLMAAARKVLVDTDAEADLILNDFPQELPREKLTVIPPAVNDPARGRVPWLTGDERIVLNVARQEPYKRTDLLIRGVAEARSRGVNARLVVIGDGTAMPDYRRLATQLADPEFVTFTGAVDEDTLGRWWASASMYATASTQEAFGIGLAQALKTGLPVVASDIPAHREVIRRAGSDIASRLCGVGSDSDVSVRFADGIVDLIQATDRRAERASYCGLPGSDEMGEVVLSSLAEAARLGGPAR